MKLVEVDNGEASRSVHAISPYNSDLITVTMPGLVHLTSGFTGLHGHHTGGNKDTQMKRTIQLRLVPTRSMILVNVSFNKDISTIRAVSRQDSGHINSLCSSIILCSDSDFSDFLGCASDRASHFIPDVSPDHGLLDSASSRVVRGKFVFRMLERLSAETGDGKTLTPLPFLG
jgi:hypothetical protein